MMITQLCNFIPHVISTDEVDRLLHFKSTASNHHDEDGHTAATLRIPFLSGWLNQRLAGTFDDRFKRFDFFVGAGGVQPHTDRDSHGYTRSILIFINVDYQGGVTWFSNARNDRVCASHPTIGGVLLFDHRTLHWADPVHKGRKTVLKGNWQ